MPETAVLDAAQTPDELASHEYRRVSPDDALKIYRLRETGLTLDQIVAATGWSAGTVHRYATQADTVEAADKLLRHKALRAAEVAVDQLESTSEKVSQGAARLVMAGAKMLGGNGQQQTIGVSIVIGMPGQPAGPDPFEAKVLTITQVETRTNEQVSQNQQVMSSDAG